jgi:hypothetical protein
MIRNDALIHKFVVFSIDEAHSAGGDGARPTVVPFGSSSDQRRRTPVATKTDFTTEEWSHVLGSVMMAGMAVTLADPSGLIGMTKEGLASGSALVAAKTDPNANALIKSVVSDFETSEGRAAARGIIQGELAGKKPSEMKQTILAALAQSATLVDTNAPEDAAGFRAWLRQISERVANASSEGGFMGFGGVKVSDAEKASLDDISKALKIAI